MPHNQHLHSEQSKMNKGEIGVKICTGLGGAKIEWKFPHVHVQNITIKNLESLTLLRKIGNTALSVKKCIKHTVHVSHVSHTSSLLFTSLQRQKMLLHNYRLVIPISYAIYHPM